MKLPTHSQYIVKILAFTIVYFIAARIGFLVPFSGEIATLIWPASAISVGVLLLYGLELWPGIALGALLIAVSNHHSLILTAGVIITHTLEPLSAAYLLKRFKQFDLNFNTLQSVIAFLICAAIISPAIGASLGTLSFFFSPEGQNSSLADLWWHWWVGHGISIMVLAPAVLTYATNPRTKWTPRQITEFWLVSVGLVTVCLMVFIRLPIYVGNYPLGHVVFPFLLWLAIRFSQREVAIMSLVASGIAVLGTVNGTGPFSRSALDTNLLLLMTFVISVVTTALIIATVINQRKIAKAELQKSHDELEVRVQARTAELVETNSQLQQEIEERKRVEADLEQARDQALEALTLKTQILANVSHDARTPLNIISLYTELLQRETYGELSDKQKECTDVILKSTSELLEFINNLLDEALLQSNVAVPKIIDLDLSKWFSKNLEPFESLAREKALTVSSFIADDLPALIQIDPEWLKQIVSNLVSNAIKFTNEGSIEVRTQRLDEDNWTICVLDTGTGIPEDAQEHIFESFWQVDGSVTRENNRGVGLGLSIVKQRVELLGGRITVQNRPEGGALFKITFPFKLIPQREGFING